jgi:hypothetical protein
MPGYVKPPVNGRMVGASEMVPSIHSQTPLTIKGAVSQTANLLNIQNSAGASIGHIDSSGRHIIPNQPTASGAKTNVGGTVAPGVIVWDSAPINAGSHYNTSNGIFTAPITGNYLAYAGVIASAENYGYLDIQRNGATVFWSHFNQTGQWHWLSVSSVVRLSANDTLNFNYRGPSAGYYGSNHNQFYIALVS